MRPMRQWNLPNTRWDWHRYYVNRFNKDQHPVAAHLAMFYLMSHLAREDEKTTGAVCIKVPSSPAAVPSAGVAKLPEAANA